MSLLGEGGQSGSGIAVWLLKAFAHAGRIKLLRIPEHEPSLVWPAIVLYWDTDFDLKLLMQSFRPELIPYKSQYNSWNPISDSLQPGSSLFEASMNYKFI